MLGPAPPQVIEEPYLKMLYTAEERYTVKKSLYSNKTSTSNSAVRPSQYLTIAVDAEEKRKLEEQIKVTYQSPATGPAHSQAPPTARTTTMKDHKRFI